MLQKILLRKKILAQRKVFNSYDFDIQNEKIINNLKLLISFLYQGFRSENKKIIKLNAQDLEVYNPSYALGLYMPLKGEPDITKIMLYVECVLCLPKILENEIIFVHYPPGARLENKSRLFQQPVSNEIIIPRVVVTPGLAFSLKGYRLGFGRGDYDRYFQKNNSNCIKIGVCFDDYLLEYIPIEAHDVKYDYIITDKITLKL